MRRKIYLPNRIRFIQNRGGGGRGAFTPNFTVLVPYSYTKPGGLAHVPLSCAHTADVHMHTATAQSVVCGVGVYIVTNHTWVLCKTALNKGWAFTPR